MKKVCPQEQNSLKLCLRNAFQKRRMSLSHDRRQEARLALCAEIKEISKMHRFVLSYASYNHELCTLQANSALAKNGKLLLPKVCGNNLKIFLVTNLKKQVASTPWGIPEPIPSQCCQIELTEITCVLVPGLVFDLNHHRLGYGKGYYDRFLHTLPPGVISCGVGFKEQQSKELLPTNLRDYSLTKQLLF